MTCVVGTSGLKPLAADFATDDEYRQYLGLPDTQEGWAVFRALPPEERKIAAEMRAVEREIAAGRIPRGVIACHRQRRQRA